MPAPIAIFWFRRDLRLTDNPALHSAAEAGEVIPVYIHAPDEEPLPPGAASRWWMHHSLAQLGRSLEQLRSRLVLRAGDSVAILNEIADETGARAVFWNRRCEPRVRERDEEVERALSERGVEVTTANGSSLISPWELSTKAGTPFRVFTPFWRAMQDRCEVDEPRPVLALRSPKSWPASQGLASLDLLPRVNWTEGLAQSWTPGEQGAAKRMSAFQSAVCAYEEDRDLPSVEATSLLSPHLAFGEIGPRQLWRTASSGRDGKAAELWLRQLGWREFAHYLLYHFPHTVSTPMRPEFGHFPWRSCRSDLLKWQRGQTGYPLVDAGMRQLWHTGWMHSRVRMVVASFLVKHLLLPWQQGASWFWDTLVDADLASNTLGWQWSAGCGADAAPYFRIFNPTSQGEKFDAAGDYVRRWVPELRGVPDRWIHRPWGAPAPGLPSVGQPANAYPGPIVGHQFARRRALDALESLKR